ncbi:iron-sulfur cluster assembly protein [Starmerella bacillaris]|uniref:Iron-sulfur cluster assembly protein n=1 Tax=Starmerella bacillaris TaxID=1247836 RepID=A0AAV5RCC6_STABA|nr:iron-sulfur cluster assembly protein [Starmerella bacillaris]
MDVKNIWLILSGKGGVGKSSTSSQVALTLASSGYKVGLLDIDITGPSIPHFFNLKSAKIHQSSAGWVPVYTDSSKNLGLMSIGFLQPDNTKSIVWRGPKKTAMIRQFLSDVVWGELDYLIIDTPPGTSDEHISIATELQSYQGNLGAILVTTPQEVAAADVRKELNFCKTVNFPILGVIENMSGYICPHCHDCTNIFSKGGGESLAKMYDVKFLGSVPLDPKLITVVEGGNFVTDYKTTDVANVYHKLLQNLVELK